MYHFTKGWKKKTDSLGKEEEEWNDEGMKEWMKEWKNERLMMKKEKEEVECVSVFIFIMCECECPFTQPCHVPVWNKK